MDKARIDRIPTVIGFVMTLLFLFFFTGASVVRDIPVITGKIPELSDVLEKAGDNKLPTGYAKVTLDAIAGRYAWVREYRGARSDLYMVWLEDDSFITFEIHEGTDRDILDSIIDDTWSYVSGETEWLSGHSKEYCVNIQPLSKDAEKYFLKGAEDYGITEPEYLLRRQVLCRVEDPMGKVQVDIMMFVVNALIAIVLFIRILSDKKKEDKELNGFSFKM